MKSLQESLFDKDIVKTDKGVGFKLMDQAFFDGEVLKRLKGAWISWSYDILVGLPGATHALGVIDWKKVRADLKRYGGTDIDLGDYAYYNSDKYKVHNAESKPKTEAFARLILCMPTAEECNFNSYNSRFRDEMCKKLDEYITGKIGTGLPAKKIYSFDVETKDGDQVDVVLWFNADSRFDNGAIEVCRWEFLKLGDNKPWA